MRSDTPTTGAESAGVKSARRAIDLLETFASQSAWLSLAELHAQTGIPRSSLHGLLRTLLEANWLEIDVAGTRYRLGPRALICGTAYLDRDPVVPFATEALENVREQTGFTTHYARRNGTQVVYLESRESRRSTHLISRVGRTLPAHATALGKALLAELTTEEIDDLLPDPMPPLTGNTLTSRGALHSEFGAIRDLGFASEVEEGTPGIRCVAAVVPYRIPGTDAMSCSMPASEVTDDEAQRAGELLAKTCVELGERLRRVGIR